MKIRYVIVIAFLAFLTGAAVSALLLTTAFVKAQLHADRAEVLVARDRITQWTKIRDPGALFAVDARPSSDLPPNYVPANQLEELKRRRLCVNLEAGTVLAADHLVKRDDRTIGDLLEPGKRAMTVWISADSSVRFFIVPGSRVDVVLIKDMKTSVVLENILVLDIDVEPAGRGTATLRLDTAEDAVKLAEATKAETLSLVMSPPGDVGKRAGAP
jgi:Flp pilus assembly protein CpaB